MEIFKPVTEPGYEEYYSISNFGHLWSNMRNKILNPATDKYGYFYFVLCHDGKRKTIKAHRLVASAFIPNTDNKPTVDHINGNKKDNRVENLKWATNKEQSNNPLTYAKLASRNDKNRMREIGALRNFGRKRVRVYFGEAYIGDFPSLLAGANYVGVSCSKASMCANGYRNHTGGYRFMWL